MDQTGHILLVAVADVDATNLVEQMMPIPRRAWIMTVYGKEPLVIR
jgi:hypothetical protein